MSDIYMYYLPQNLDKYQILIKDLGWLRTCIKKKFNTIIIQAYLPIILHRSFWVWGKLLSIKVEFFYISDECRKCSENSDVRFYLLKLRLRYQKVRFSAPIWCASESRRIQPKVGNLEMYDDYTFMTLLYMWTLLFSYRLCIN